MAPYFDGEWRQGGLKQAGWHTDRTVIISIVVSFRTGQALLKCHLAGLIFVPTSPQLALSLVFPNTANEDVKVVHVGMP